MPNFNISTDTLLSIINTLPVGILLVDGEGIIQFSNSQAEVILAFDRDELLGLSVNALVPVKIKHKHASLVTQYLSAPKDKPMDSGRLLTAIQKNGHEIQVQIGLSPITISGTIHILVSMIDAKNQVLKIASHHDPLTGLANRVLFDELSENLRQLAIRNQTSLSLVFIDLDNFKYINDQFGHQIGDTVLTQVADILSNNIRGNDILGRVGGDEFILCLYGFKDTDTLEAITDRFITDINAINKELIQDSEAHPLLSASIGIIYTTKPDTTTIRDMTSKADKLMYQAKNTGKGKAKISVY